MADATDTTDRIDNRVQVRAPPFPGRSYPYENNVVRRPAHVVVDVGDNSFERQDQFEAGGNQGTTQRNWSTTTIATGRVYYQRQEYNEVVPVAPSSSAATHATANTSGGSLAKQLLYSCALISCGAVAMACYPWVD